MRGRPTTGPQPRSEIERKVFRPINLVVLLAIVVMAALWLAAEKRNRMFYAQQMRTDVIQDLNVLRTQLEGELNANIQLIRGLIATLITEPDMTQDRFSSIAKGLIGEFTQIRNVAAAPDMVIRMIYPVQENAAAIGLDYLTSDLQRDTAIRARESGSLVLAGPVNLVQGGTGFIGRFPVLIPQTDAPPRFWGLISAVIDERSLYDKAGLLAADLPIEVAISGRDASGAQGEVFFGDPSLLEQDAVVMQVLLPSGSWQIAAIPVGGWDKTPPTTPILRAVMLMAGFLLLLPSVMMGRLIEERQRNIAKLQSSNAALSTRMTELEQARATQQKTEAKLREALDAQEQINTRFSDVAAISRSWVWEQDAALHFTYLSEGFEAVTGYRPDTVLGQAQNTFYSTFANRTEGMDWSWLDDKIKACEPFHDVNFGFRAKDGRELWLLISGTPIFDQNGQFCGYRGVGTDVTSIHAATVAAEEANRVKSMFLANMSHEIRTPMNGILGMVEVMERSLTTPSQKQMIDVIRSSGETLLAILNDILDLSKIEADKMELEVIPFRLDEVAQRIETLHSLKAREKGLRLEVFTDNRVRIDRMGDPHRITQILHNLVSNAIKFTDKGKITVWISALSGDDIRIEVEDSGIGMTPEQQSRIFDEFVQADGTMTRRFGGTGLGMSIVRRLIDMMDGQMSVDSALGQGTTFRITLPLPPAKPHDTASTQPQTATALPPLIDLSGRHILVADDNDVNLDVLAAMLDETGAKLTFARNGQQALDAFAVSPFDMLLLDISMPVMDGRTALQQMIAAAAKDERTMPPAIAFTANLMPYQISEYLQAGFVDVLSKPVKRQALLDQIEQHIIRQAGSDA
ncbi:MAG: ATP-binding protein [Rhodobacterales bacterium]